MTTAELLIGLARANLAAGAAILAVLALRAPVRRAFGAQLAYGLWLMVPAAVVGALTPSAIGSPGWAPAVAAAGDAGAAWLAGEGRAQMLAALWLAGVVASGALALWRQSRFAAAARTGRAGPAVVGVLRPRLVTPADFAQRFSAAEQRLIRAHEFAHVRRQDGRVAALAQATVWLGWFNPLAHLALAALRVDQELACDATVMARLPNARRAYAAAMLRADPVTRDLVFGSAWRASAHPLATRLAALARRAPDAMWRDTGHAAVSALAIASFAAAWAARPPPPAPTEPTSPGETVILMELSPPEPSQAAWVYRAEPPRPALPR